MHMNRNASSRLSNRFTRPHSTEQTQQGSGGRGRRLYLHSNLRGWEKAGHCTPPANQLGELFVKLKKFLENSRTALGSETENVN